MSAERTREASYGHTLEMEGDKIVAIISPTWRKVELGQRVKANQRYYGAAGLMGTVRVIYDPRTRQTSDYIGVVWDGDKPDAVNPVRFQQLDL